MEQQVLDPIFSAITIAIVGVLVTIIKVVGDSAISYVKTKKKVINEKLQLDKHTHEIEVAKQIWNVVEENYRISDSLRDMAKSKADEFDKLLLEKIPYLTESQIIMLRQTIAGEVNKGKGMLHQDILKDQAAKLTEDNSKLKTENEELKNKLNAISNYVPGIKKEGE